MKRNDIQKSFYKHKYRFPEGSNKSVSLCMNSYRLNINDNIALSPFIYTVLVNSQFTTLCEDPCSYMSIDIIKDINHYFLITKKTGKMIQDAV